MNKLVLIMRQNNDLEQRYGVVFYHTYPKYHSVVGVVDPDKKETDPIAFDFEGALEYLRGRRSFAVSRGYDIAKIHAITLEGKLGDVHKTFQLGWQEVNKDTVANRVL